MNFVDSTKIIRPVAFNASLKENFFSHKMPVDLVNLLINNEIANFLRINFKKKLFFLQHFITVSQSIIKNIHRIAIQSGKIITFRNVFKRVEKKN